MGSQRVFCTPRDSHTAGSTDVGDVQHLLPVLTFNTGGSTGGLHASEFDIVDEEEAYLDAAKVFAIHAYELLKDQAKLARETAANYQPAFASFAEYGAYLDQFRTLRESAEEP